MKKYGYVELTKGGINILVTWTENIINRIVSDVTNTVCYKPVRDLITGEIIVPDPFIYWDGESTNVKPAKRIPYVNGPREISIEEAKKALAELRENPEKLIEYINNIQLMKATKNIERISHKF